MTTQSLTSTPRLAATRSLGSLRLRATIFVVLISDAHDQYVAVANKRNDIKANRQLVKMIARCQNIIQTDLACIEAALQPDCHDALYGILSTIRCQLPFATVEYLIRDSIRAVEATKIIKEQTELLDTLISTS